MSSINVPVPDDFEARLAERTRRRMEQNACHISIEADSISVRFDNPLPDGPHKVTRMELMAAAALLGIARTLTGAGEAAVLAAMEKVGNGTKLRAKR